MPFYTSESFRPETSVGYLVRRAHQLGIAALDPIYAEEGLTAAQWSALITLHVGEATTCVDVAREIAHDKGAMTRIVDQLEERGLLVRERSASDRRQNRLRLTEEGVAITLRCRDRILAAWNVWLADWDSAEVERLIASLQRLTRTLGGAAEDRA